MKIFFLGLILFHSIVSFAATESRLFVLEKSYNPENILIVHALTDQNCKFVKSGNGYLDFYWRMDNDSQKPWNKPVNSMIRTKTNERLKITAINSTKDNYKLALTDLSELKHDLQDTTVDVVAQIQEGKCLSKAIIKLGPSGNYRKMSLSKIHCTASKNFVGVPDGCKKITLSGSDADSNEKLKDVVFYEK